MSAVVTGLGAVSALGRGVAPLWSAMAEGRDGFTPLRRFDPREVGVELAALVPDRNAPAHGDTAPLCVELAIAAVREAWSTARLDEVARDRIAIVLGCGLGDRGTYVQDITQRVADAVGIAGPRLTISTACASSTNAIGLGLDLLALGAAGVVIAGGVDVLGRLLLAGFNALGVLAPGKCAPFSEPSGTSLGEGAGFLVLERDDSRVRASLAVYGYGLSADAFHDTGPDPSGRGVARGISAALAHAGVNATDIDYVNAHGTGTVANDPAEWRAIQHVFGPRSSTLPVSSSKSFLGHAQGAAGALEAIATLLAMEHGSIPPTQQFTVARPQSPNDPVGQPTARRGHCDLAVSTNSAFGGANCALVLGRTGRVAPSRRARRRVSIAGCGVVGPHGTLLGDLLAARVRGHVRGYQLEVVLPSADPRGLDPMTRYLLGAAVLTLADAGIRVRASTRDRTGIVLGILGASPESEAALYRTIDEHGYAGLSAHLFARQVLNAPAGTCAKLLGLRGPMSTLSVDRASGLAAVIYAAEMLATRDDSELILAAGVDELPVVGAEDRSEGAACIALAATPGSVELAGWGFAGPNGLNEAVRDALVMSGIENVDAVVGDLPAGVSPAHVVDPAELVGDSAAFTSATAVAVATLLVRTGQARSVLVSRNGTAAGCAAVLTAGESHGA